MTAGSKRTKVSSDEILKNYIRKNLKLIKQCSEEFVRTNRLMACVKRFGLPRRRLIYETINRYAPKTYHVTYKCNPPPEESVPLVINIISNVSNQDKPEHQKVYKQLIAEYESDLYVWDELVRSWRISGIDSLKGVTENIELDNRELPALKMDRFDAMKRFMKLWNETKMHDPPRKPVFIEPGGWTRDLTREGIEPNPGPRTIKQMVKKNNKGRRNIKPIRRTNRPNQTVQKQREIKYLDYVESITDYNNTGGPIVSGEYRFTDIYDIDPLILSRSVQFAQYMFDIYTYAKVLSASIHYTFDNLEQHALDIFTYHSTVPLLSSLGSKTQLESQAATALCNNHVTLSEQYGKKSQVNINYILKSGVVLGNSLEFRALDDFSCTSSSGPTRPLYTSWAVFSSAGTIPAGFTMRATIRLKVLFYNPRSIPTPLYIARNGNSEEKPVISAKPINNNKNDVKVSGQRHNR